MRPATFFVALTSMVAVPAVMLLCFHALLYWLRPDVPVDLQEASRWVWNYLLHDASLLLPKTEMLDMRGRRHMLDVKRILVDTRHVWWGVTIAFLLLLSVQLRSRVLQARVLCWTGYAGLTILLGGILLAVLNFRWAFVMLHYLLFSGQTWVFPADSLLIRLFPLSYFQQFFIYWGVLCVTGFLLMLVGGRFLAKKSG